MALFPLFNIFHFFCFIIAATTILDLCKVYKSVGVELLLVGLNVHAISTLERTKAIDVIGRDHLFVRLDDALAYARKLTKLERPTSVRFDEEGKIDPDVPPVGGLDEFGMRPADGGHEFSQPVKF